MKRMTLSEYKRNMGILIDLEDSETYEKNHLPGAKNIPYERLLLNYRDLLDKNESYYLYCEKGRKSHRLANILEIYGYDVTQVYNG